MGCPSSPAIWNCQGARLLTDMTSCFSAFEIFPSDISDSSSRAMWKTCGTRNTSPESQGTNMEIGHAVGNRNLFEGVHPSWAVPNFQPTTPDHWRRQTLRPAACGCGVTGLKLTRRMPSSHLLSAWDFNPRHRQWPCDFDIRISVNNQEPFEKHVLQKTKILSEGIIVQCPFKLRLSCEQVSTRKSRKEKSQPCFRLHKLMVRVEVECPSPLQRRNTLCFLAIDFYLSFADTIVILHANIVDGDPGAMHSNDLAIIFHHHLDGEIRMSSRLKQQKRICWNTVDLPGAHFHSKQWNRRTHKPKFARSKAIPLLPPDLLQNG